MYHNKRIPEESELNIIKTIVENFNLLMVCDNDRYPAYFRLRMKYKNKNILIWEVELKLAIS